MVTIRRMILLIPLLGVTAGAFALFDTRTIGIGLLIIGAAALMIRALIRLSRAEPKEFIPPHITGATVSQVNRETVGELTVAADHPSKVSALSLPIGAKIRDLKRNELYAVSFPIPQRRNPLSYTIEIARINGYKAGG